MRQLFKEHTDVTDDDKVEEIAIELEDLEQLEVPKVVSIIKTRDMVTQLISFTKAHSLFSEELNLLSLNVILKDLYNYVLNLSKIHQYFNDRINLENYNCKKARVLDFGLKVRDSS
jgi:hypothetical protein